MTSSVHSVVPVLQKYAWGVQNNKNSMVEKLFKEGPNCESSTLMPEDRFAELWMGCHPNGMATVVTDSGEKVPVDQYIKNNKIDDIRYMFKVLSVEKPLSLQLHPSKSVAELLHKTSPHIYKDPNHKPEIAIALSEEFHALAGFRSFEFLKDVISRYPFVKNVFFGSDAVPTSYAEFVKTALQSLVQPKDCPADFEQDIAKMRDICSDFEKSIPLMLREAMDVFLTLVEEYTCDKSVFSAFLMNKYTLKAGECIYLDAGLLHAYIKGDCVECMASSDNVIRGGLTPKFIDVENLLKYTRFEEGGAQMITPSLLSSGVREYRAPVDDFVVKHLSINNQTQYTIDAAALGCNGLSMAVVLSGTAEISNPAKINLSCGTVLALDPKFKIDLSDVDSLEMWIATQ